MRFDVLTIFPHIFDSYLRESMIKRALKRGLIEIHLWDLRKWGIGPRKKVDDRVYGGGPGMVMRIEPIARAIGSILKLKTQNSKLKTKVKIILLSPAGKQFAAVEAKQWAKKYEQIIFICGRYEGIDARLVPILKAESYNLEVISIGPYVLSGGELPALVMLETIARHIPGFLGKLEYLEESRDGIGVPVYTRPEEFRYRGADKAFKIRKVPKVLLSGDHQKIKIWRRQKCKKCKN